MNYSNIQFLKTKKYQKNYISLAHMNNKKVAFFIKNVNLNKSLYKKNNKLYIQISFENNHKINKKIDNIKKITVDYVMNKFKINKDSRNVIENNYINIIKNIENKNILELEIHPECKFISKNQYDIKSEDSYKNLKYDDNIDIILIFRGILFGKKKYTTNFFIHEIIRNYKEEDIINECILNSDSDNDSEEDIQLYSNKYKKRFKELFKNKNNSKIIVEEIINKLIKKL